VPESVRNTHINIAEPDPEYQPFILTDEASLFDAVATGEDDAAAITSSFALRCAGRFRRACIAWPPVSLRP
jgi:hypothetical protein